MSSVFITKEITDTDDYVLWFSVVGEIKEHQPNLVLKTKLKYHT